MTEMLGVLAWSLLIQTTHLMQSGSKNLRLS